MITRRLAVNHLFQVSSFNIPLCLPPLCVCVCVCVCVSVRLHTRMLLHTKCVLRTDSTLGAQRHTPLPPKYIVASHPYRRRRNPAPGVPLAKGPDELSRERGKSGGPDTTYSVRTCARG
ncbi:hypothetical protein LX36DRAFT_43108 [Colletotrichum falcatum]|nr:hypothetical protein LX36DRAFT_43108 [Colletotrichum falcatum]